MSAKSISFNGVISSIRAKVDRSISATFSTPELSSEERSLFFDLQNINVKMTITPLDEPSEEYVIDKDLDQKSQSQRIRSVLYILFCQNSEGMDWETYTLCASC